jgi:hypothetical protein
VKTVFSRSEALSNMDFCSGGAIKNAVISEGMKYGVRPRRTSALEAQLGLVPGTKSKIEDGSTVGT